MCETIVEAPNRPLVHFQKLTLAAFALCWKRNLKIYVPERPDDVASYFSGRGTQRSIADEFE